MMTYVKIFENFDANTENTMTPKLQKSLTELSNGFETDQEIVDAIIKLGFNQRPSTTLSGKTGDYVFYDPITKATYTSSTAGYVRFYQQQKSWRDGNVTTRTPITRTELKSPTDRLLLILRRALKLSDLYSDWKRTSLTVKDFLEKSKAILTAKRFGI